MPNQKSLKDYKRELLSAFDRAGGINRVVVLCREDATFLNLFADLVKLMPKEVDHKHDVNVQYVSNTPRPKLVTDIDLHTIEYTNNEGGSIDHTQGDTDKRTPGTPDPTPS